MLKPTQISARAPIMPIMRVSTSVALSSRRMAGSFGAALVALGAAEVMLLLPIFTLAPPAGMTAGSLATKSRAALRAARPSFVSLDENPVNSLAEGDRAGLHAGADFVLGDPALVDDRVKVVLGDGERGQKDAVDLDALGAAGERLDHGDIGHLLFVGEIDRRFAGDPTQIAGVLPDRHGLGAERDAVDRRVVAVLARDWDRAGHALGGQRRDDAAGHAVVLGDDRVDLVVILGEDLLH